jgi:uncharacterized DUF497 family protein
MKPFRWNAEKNNWLMQERGVSFESMVVAIEGAGLLDILAYPNDERYPGQRILVVAHEGYAYLVPFVEEAEHFFLKTVIPSRKATRGYLQEGDDDGQD